MTHSIARTLTAVTFLASSTITQAVVLTGSGLLPIPVPNDLITWVGPTYTPASFTTLNAAWATPAASPWTGGTFDVSRPSGAAIPSSLIVGKFRYDFGNMTNGGGLLPLGTYFWIGDVDNGSGNNEFMELQAWDAAGTLLSEWLDVPLYVYGSGVTASAMTAYAWNGASMSYTFNGNAVPLNPSIGIFMENNQEIAVLSLDKVDTHYSFALNAPEAVPVPAAIWLFGSGLLGLMGVARRKVALI